MGSSREDEGNFRFNHIEFSDGILHLEITPALSSNTSEVSNTSEDSAAGLKIKKIHINSLMLAYKSQFFYKLFKNVMKETQQSSEVALRINESEEAAFMDLLKFIYDQSINASSAADLVDVLMAADKFEIPSCVKCCVDLLLKLPMSTELALYYLELPSSVLEDEVVQTLIGSAKRYICTHHRDFRKFKDEAMSLPLCAVELVIGSDGLEVDSEDDVFDFMLKWGRLHYPELEERREILTRLLLNFVCLPKMSSLKLKDVLHCSDFNFEIVWKPVVDALVSKDQDVPPTSIYKYPRRVYNLRDVKVVQLQLARPCCLVYFDLSKKELSDLVPFKRIDSQTFCLGGRQILLSAKRKQEQGTIGLYVTLMEGSESCTLAFGISVVKKSNSKVFTSLIEPSNSVFQPNQSWGRHDPFEMPWDELMSEDSEYFIDGILHLRFDITLISHH